MSKIYIDDYGLCLGKISNIEDVVELVEKNLRIEDVNNSDLEEIGKRREYRRMDRFSLLVEQAMQHMIANGQTQIRNNEEEFRIGSIINTSYGCLDTNLEFIRQIEMNDLSQLSPTLFAHTVYNAALGHMCQKYKFRGQSTMVLSCNYIFIAMQMIKHHNVEYCYAGGAEAYIKELIEYLESIQVKFTECACILKLENEKRAGTIGEIIDFSECNMHGHPYFGQKDMSEKNIQQCITDVLKRNQIVSEDISFVVSSSFYDSESIVEEKVIQTVIPNVQVIPIKHYIGETLGAALGVAILYSSKKLENQEGKYALVCNYDIGGNYIVYLIKSVK